MSTNQKKKILFICTHNSARSQMAEALLKEHYGQIYEVESAGIHPSQVNPYAIQVMKEMGIDISRQKSKNISSLKDREFDYVITVCDQAKESCPFFPGKHILHKGFADPSRFEGSEEEMIQQFRKVRDQIQEWIIKAFKELDDQDALFMNFILSII